MKTGKFFFFFLLCLLTFSCGKDNVFLYEQENDSFDKVSFNVSQDLAKFLVEQTVKDKDIKSIFPFIEGSDTLLYVFNFTDGWMIVSGDKRTDPILGSNCSGRLSENLNDARTSICLDNVAGIIRQFKCNYIQEYDKEKVEFWNFFEDASSVHNRSRSNLTRVSIDIDTSEEGSCYWVKRPVSSVRTEVSTTNLVPKLTITKWGQNYPWNDGFPYGPNSSGNIVYCPTGCEAVAVAQLLYFFHYAIGIPSGLYHDVSLTGYLQDDNNFTITFSRGGYTENSPRWDLMALDDSDSHTDYVQDLMADVGYRLDLNYSVDGTGGDDIETGEFASFGLKCEKADYNYDIVRSNLMSGKPILITAFATQSKKGIKPFDYYVYSNGHCWLIDGLRNNTYRYTQKYKWIYVNPALTPGFSTENGDIIYSVLDAEAAYPNIYNNMVCEESAYSSVNFLLMNWGWNGSSADYTEYYTSGSSDWAANGKNYFYKRTILYNFQSL